MTLRGFTAHAAESDGAAHELDELQFMLGEGPTSDAFRSGRPVLIPDLAATDGRWSEFTNLARSKQVGGVYAFPLQLGAARLGVLTCYASHSPPLRTDQVVICLDLAEEARDLLLEATDHGVDGQRDVQDSLPIRTEVYQAQGKLMVHLEISLTDALAYLRAMAYSEDLDINDLAADIVNGSRPMPRRGSDSS